MTWPWHQSVVITLAIVNVAVVLEILLSFLFKRRVYSLAGTLTNISAYTVYLIIAAVYGYTEYLIMTYLQLSLAVPKIPAVWWYWPALILADDFCFYWFHRCSHRFGILWISHTVHHSSPEFNLSVGLRQTWLPFAGIVFWIPLACAGFRVEDMLLVQAGSLTYQFFMHTQLLNLPQFWGYVFNTPSHHRVHHGTNAEYIDKNFAGVLIIWDRLFGSFTAEKNPVSFGIHEPAPRGEIIFAQVWGIVAFFNSLFSGQTKPPVPDAYARQKTSAALAVFFLALSLIAFYFAVRYPRWFI